MVDALIAGGVGGEMSGLKSLLKFSRLRSCYNRVAERGLSNEAYGVAQFIKYFNNESWDDLSRN